MRKALPEQAITLLATTGTEVITAQMFDRQARRWDRFGRHLGVLDTDGRGIVSLAADARGRVLVADEGGYVRVFSGDGGLESIIGPWVEPLSTMGLVDAQFFGVSSSGALMTVDVSRPLD